MRFGMPWWIGAGEPDVGLRAAGAAGFDFVELSLDEPWPGGLDAEALRQDAADAGVTLGIHAPWRAQTIMHPRAELAKAACRVLEECVDFAQDVGARYLVLHVAASGFRDTYPRRSALEQGLSHAREHVRTLVGRARGLPVVVENTCAPFGTPAECSAFLAIVPEAGFCYDPGHSADAWGDDHDDEAWMPLLRNRFAVLHLMDWVRVDGVVQDHLVPGAGDADCAGIARLARDAACADVVLECFHRDRTRGKPARTPATIEDLAAARKRIAEAISQ